MAVKAPQVRDLQKLIATQNKALQPQYNLINSDIAANDKAGAAQEAGLTAQKDTAFQDITQGAQDKGMFFSGFSPDQQAKYTAGTYLPALAQLQATIAQTRSNLLGKKTDLGTKAYDTATNQRENDIAALRDWNKMSADQQFNASEAQKQRVFTAHQNELQRSADAAHAAAANAGISSTEQKKQDVGAAHSFLQGLSGRDNFVSPTTYAQAKSLWSALGYTPKEFDQQFAAYRNPKNKYYKLG